MSEQKNEIVQFILLKMGISMLHTEDEMGVDSQSQEMFYQTTIAVFYMYELVKTYPDDADLLKLCKVRFMPDNEAGTELNKLRSMIDKLLEYWKRVPLEGSSYRSQFIKEDGLQWADFFMSVLS